MQSEKIKEWSTIKKNGVIKWWLRDGITNFFIPTFISITFIINPIILNTGFKYFISNFFMKSMFLNALILLLLSIIKAILTWKVINEKYRKEIN